jgi:hypothetical protein
VLVNRVWLTPFSAPLESTRSPEANSQPSEEQETFGQDNLWSKLIEKLSKLCRGVDLSFK